MVETYISLFSSPAEALRAINSALGASYGANRIYEWRSRARSIPKPVLDYIRLQITTPVLSSEGIEVSEETGQRIARRLS